MGRPDPPIPPLLGAEVAWPDLAEDEERLAPDTEVTRPGADTLELVTVTIRVVGASVDVDEGGAAVEVTTTGATDEVAAADEEATGMAEEIGVVDVVDVVDDDDDDDDVVGTVEDETTGATDDGAVVGATLDGGADDGTAEVVAAADVARDQYRERRRIADSLVAGAEDGTTATGVVGATAEVAGGATDGRPSSITGEVMGAGAAIVYEVRIAPVSSKRVESIR